MNSTTVSTMEFSSIVNELYASIVVCYGHIV